MGVVEVVYSKSKRLFDIASRLGGGAGGRASAVAGVVLLARWASERTGGHGGWAAGGAVLVCDACT